MRVADETINMVEGRPFVFDDSFEHEAYNDDSEQCRIVLIIDVWHPDLSPTEVKFFTYLRNAQLRVDKQVATMSEDDDNFYSIISRAYHSNTTPENAVWA